MRVLHAVPQTRSAFTLLKASQLLFDLADELGTQELAAFLLVDEFEHSVGRRLNQGLEELVS